MKKYIITFLLFSFLLLNFALSQIPPDRDGLLNGEGMGQGKFADMNGYPGPKHVLDLAKDLKLTDQQMKSVQQIYEEMRIRAKELGKRIVAVEEELNKAFRDGFVSEKAVREDAEQIGRMRGKLRAVHLAAHLLTKSVLTPTQIELYKKLRSVDKNETNDQKQ